MRKYITKASERIGVESTSRDGKRAQVVSYSTCENFIIRFCDGKEMKLKNWRYFIEGNFNYEKHFKAPRNREERIGEKKVMNNENIETMKAYMCKQRGMHLGSKISREEITKKVNQSKYEKYCYITNRLRREQFPLGLFKYSSKIENYICSILCIRYIF